jgi:NAD(P)-dependent dehydrogenase (short-subunit alcohol dehydrogenase family)
MHVPRVARRVASRLVNPPGGVSEAELRAAVGGKTILVTGASHGIGRATALRLGAAGATVVALARSGDLLDELAEEIAAAGGRAHALAVDLTDLDAVAEAAERIEADHPPLDALVNNAGKSIRRSLALSYDRFHDVTRTIGVNYLGPVRLLLALLPGMCERGAGQVVNVSTIGVLVPPAPRWAAYQASKSAFDVWLRSVRAELAADGVATTSIYLALVHTRMSAPTDDFDWVPGLRPDQAADLVCHALVHRPRTIAPWWASAAQVVDGVAGGVSDLVMRRYYRRTVDSASASGASVAP